MISLWLFDDAVTLVLQLSDLLRCGSTIRGFNSMLFNSTTFYDWLLSKAVFIHLSRSVRCPDPGARARPVIVDPPRYPRVPV